MQTFLDGEIDDLRAVAIHDHLRACPACGLEAEAYGWLKAAIAGLTPVEDPGQLQLIRAFADELTAGDRR